MGKVNESKEVSEAVWRLFFTTPGTDLHHHVARPRGGGVHHVKRAQLHGGRVLLGVLRTAMLVVA